MVDACNATTALMVNITASCSGYPAPAVTPRSMRKVVFNGGDAPLSAAYPQGWFQPHVLDAGPTRLIDEAFLTVEYANFSKGEIPIPLWEDAPYWVGTNLFDPPINGIVSSLPVAWQRRDGLQYVWTVVSAPHGSAAWAPPPGAVTNATLAKALGVPLYIPVPPAEVDPTYKAPYVNPTSPDGSGGVHIEPMNNISASVTPDIAGDYVFRVNVSNFCWRAAAGCPHCAARGSGGFVSAPPRQGRGRTARTGRTGRSMFLDVPVTFTCAPPPSVNVTYEVTTQARGRRNPPQPSATLPPSAAAFPGRRAPRRANAPTVLSTRLSARLSARPPVRRRTFACRWLCWTRPRHPPPPPRGPSTSNGTRPAWRRTAGPTPAYMRRSGARTVRGPPPHPHPLRASARSRTDG